MNKFDKEIRKMAKQSKCPVSKEYEEEIERLLKTLKNQEINSTKRSSVPIFKFGIAACTVCVIMLSSVPVAAKISDYVKERMSKMSEQEQEEYRETNNSEKLTNEHETETIRYSRDMSEEETARYHELAAKYKTEGLFPEEEIQMIDKLEDNTEISSLLYEVYNREFYLPERELTDEELLQMVDFFHKLNYSISQDEEVKNIISAQNEFNENPYPSENDMSEEEATEKAAAYLKGMYDVDTSAMEKTAEFWMGYGYEGYGDYDVTFTDSAKNSYSVNLYAETGTLYSIEADNSLLTITEPTEITEDFIGSNYEKAKNIFTGVLGADTEIVSSNCTYPVDEDGNLAVGSLGAITYVFEIANGNAYYIEYDIVNEAFYMMHYTQNYTATKKAYERGIIEKDGNNFVTLVAGSRIAVISME